MLTTINVMLDNGAIAPERAHLADAGLDIKIPYCAHISPHDSLTIDTGVHVEIPRGYVGFLKSKSGLNVKCGLTGEGVIDSGYTGSIVAKLYNHTDSGFNFKRGDKIIQLVILPVELPIVKIVDKFSDTERGDKGFGSTGR